MAKLDTFGRDIFERKLIDSDWALIMEIGFGSSELRRFQCLTIGYTIHVPIPSLV